MLFSIIFEKSNFYCYLFNLFENISYLTVMGIRYYRKLTIKENAEKNKCSVSAVKMHLQKLNLSASKARKANIVENITNAKVALEKEGVKPTIRSVHELTGYANKTILKYWSDGVKKDMSKSTPQSYSYRQQEIIQNIINLYCDGKPIQCDLTFSLGKMWKGLFIPEHCFDIKPQLPHVKHLDDSKLFEGFFSSCLFDLPFTIHPQPKEPNAIICNRFDAFSSERELYQANTKMLELTFYVLKLRGICIIKTQDTCYAGKQIWTHQYIMNEAKRIGFKIEDLFICLSKNMLVNQAVIAKHARKQHCYFLVLRKI